MPKGAYTYRNLLNSYILSNDEEYMPGGVPVASQLEAYANAMRYAMSSVRHYSPAYNYYDVVRYANDQAKRILESHS